MIHTDIYQGKSINKDCWDKSTIGKNILKKNDVMLNITKIDLKLYNTYLEHWTTQMARNFKKKKTYRLCKL